MGTSTCAPSRTAVAFELATMESLSVVRLERISCTMPMMVLQMMMTMNSAFFNDPVNSTNAAKSTFIPLKSVQMFSRAMVRSDRVFTPVSTFTSPAAMREATSSAVNPAGWLPFRDAFAGLCCSVIALLLYRSSKNVQPLRPFSFVRYSARSASL